MGSVLNVCNKHWWTLRLHVCRWLRIIDIIWMYHNNNNSTNFQSVSWAYKTWTVWGFKSYSISILRVVVYPPTASCMCLPNSFMYFIVLLFILINVLSTINQFLIRIVTVDFSFVIAPPRRGLVGVVHSFNAPLCWTMYLSFASITARGGANKTNTISFALVGWTMWCFVVLNNSRDLNPIGFSFRGSALHGPTRPSWLGYDGGGGPKRGLASLVLRCTCA